MLALLSQLRHKCAIGYVGGSDLSKQQEQLGTASIPVTTLFDFCFPENGLLAFRMGQPLATTSFIGWIGDEKYKKLANFILHYIADLDIPVKRGTFVYQVSIPNSKTSRIFKILHRRSEHSFKQPGTSSRCTI